VAVKKERRDRDIAFSFLVDTDKPGTGLF